MFNNRFRLGDGAVWFSVNDACGTGLFSGDEGRGDVEVLRRGSDRGGMGKVNGIELSAFIGKKVVVFIEVDAAVLIVAGFSPSPPLSINNPIVTTALTSEYEGIQQSF